MMVKLLMVKLNTKGLSSPPLLLLRLLLHLQCREVWGLGCGVWRLGVRVWELRLLTPLPPPHPVPPVNDVGFDS